MYQTSAYLSTSSHGPRGPDPTAVRYVKICEDLQRTGLAHRRIAVGSSDVTQSPGFQSGHQRRELPVAPFGDPTFDMQGQLRIDLGLG